MTESAREILKREFGSSKNLLTPRIIKIGKINRCVAYELCKGVGIEGENIYGVLVVGYNGECTINLSYLSKMFFNLNRALGYIESLRDEVIDMKNTKDLCL